MLINNEFNKLQINEVIEKDAEGNVFKKSLMLNIRCNDVDEAEKLYRQLKAKFNGNIGVKGNSKSEAINNNAPRCECGKPMVIRKGKNGTFYGCSGYPQCRKTKELNGSEMDEAQVVEAVF